MPLYLLLHQGPDAIPLGTLVVGERYTVTQPSPQFSIFAELTAGSTLSPVTESPHQQNTNGRAVYSAETEQRIDWPWQRIPTIPTGLRRILDQIEGRPTVRENPQSSPSSNGVGDRPVFISPVIAPARQDLRFTGVKPGVHPDIHRT
jgi:hypothetical protein